MSQSIGDEFHWFYAIQVEKTDNYTFFYAEHHHVKY